MRKRTSYGHSARSQFAYNDKYTEKHERYDYLKGLKRLKEDIDRTFVFVRGNILK